MSRRRATRAALSLPALVVPAQLRAGARPEAFPLRSRLGVVSAPAAVREDTAGRRPEEEGWP